MVKLDNNIKVFFALVRAGLWEKTVEFTDFCSQFIEGLDWEEVYRLASEQSVLGLVLAGIDYLPNDLRPPKVLLLQWIGEVQMLEQQNKEMNDYVAWLIGLLRKEDIYAILVKGQGIAQCYEKPLWRSSGDVDLLLSDTNYEKVKNVLLPLAESVEQEYTSFKHLGMSMPGGFTVELHGTMHSRLSGCMDKIIDEAHRDVYSGNVRSWMNGNTTVFLPSPDNDVIFVFTHILKHFYIEGVGLRQICDWCGLLLTYKDSLNHRLLKSRISRAGLMTEWDAFAAFAVYYLGMPVEAMPLFDEKDSPNNNLHKKADHIMDYVLGYGNFGHNRQKPYGGKILSAWRKMKGFARHARAFPMDSIKFFLHFMGDGIHLVIEKYKS